MQIKVNCLRLYLFLLLERMYGSAWRSCVSSAIRCVVYYVPELGSLSKLLFGHT